MRSFSEIVARLARVFEQQDPIGLAQCAQVCFEKAAPEAASWGCFGSTNFCLCEDPWFASDFKQCVRHSCPGIDRDDADLQVQTHCNNLIQRNAQISGYDSFIPSAFSAPTIFTIPAVLTPTTAATPNTTPTPTNAVNTQTTPTTITAKSTTRSTPSTTSLSTTSSESTTSSTSASSSSSSSKATTSSTSTSATPSSKPPSDGVSQSAKLGIGLGVSFGIIFLALIGYGLFYYVRHKQQSRARHMGNIAAAGLYPVVDNADAEKEGPVHVGAVPARHEEVAPVSPGPEGGELHGQHIPPYSRELEGSAVYGRRELP